MRRLLLAAGGGGSFAGAVTGLWGFVNGQLGGPPQEMYVETSTDGGVTFTEGNAGSPVIPVGAPGSWNSDYVALASIIEVADGYDLWASGFNGTIWQTGKWHSTVLSDDPADWPPDAGNPILTVGGAGEDDEDGAYVPSAQYDAATGTTRIWYTAIRGSTTVIMYAERSSGGTVTKYGKVLGLGAGGAFDDAGLSGAALLEIGGEKRLYYTGWDGGDFIGGYATYTDPQDDATYTKQGSLSAFTGPVTLDGSYDTYVPTCFIRSAAGWIVLGTAFHPTGSANQREITTRAFTYDGLTFTAPVGPAVPMSTAYPGIESRENATMLAV